MTLHKTLQVLLPLALGLSVAGAAQACPGDDAKASHAAKPAVTKQAKVVPATPVAAVKSPAAKAEQRAVDAAKARSAQNG